MKEKEKLVVVALGKLYENNKTALAENFTIVALADNNLSKLQNRNDNHKYITIQEIKQETFDKILICTNRQFTPLKAQLLDEGISPAVIYGPEMLEHISWEKDYQKFCADRESYQKLYQDLSCDKFPLLETEQCIMLSDYRNHAGTIDGHYFYQDIFIASQVIQRRPRHHMDVGSRIDGFISHLLAAGIETTAIDIRPLPIWEMGYGITNLRFIQADATNLQGIADHSVQSLSSLHAVEHFGLGRYGDAVNPNACFDAMRALERVLAYDGMLYLSVPVGKEEKLMFNGHRIFSPLTVVKTMEQMQLLELYAIHANSLLRFSGDAVLQERYRDCLGDYDCGMFLFTKKGSV